LTKRNYQNTIVLSFSSLEVRLQLAEQLRIFDGQVEQKTQVFQDLVDYLRRRGEIEGEYARSLDKLCDRFSSRTRK